MATTLSMKKGTRFGLWNVRTMLDIAKLEQVEKEMTQYKLEFLGLCETRWPDSGEYKTESGMSLIFSGKHPELPRSSGVGLLMSTNTRKALIEWKPICDRIIMARFRTRVRNLTCVQCYAPTDAATDDDKKASYSNLSTVLDNINIGDIKIVLGDFNAQLGSNNMGREKVMGKHGLGRLTDNGIMFTELCSNHNLVIGGTLFPHRDIHKVTWVSPDHTTENQIDHIAISRTWRGSLLDVRCKRGADVGSDHHLVVGVIRLKVVAVAQKNQQKIKRKIDIEKLSRAPTKSAFVSELRSRSCAIINEGCHNPVEYWSQTKSMLLDTGQKHLGYVKMRRKPWISDSTWKLINNRKQLKNDRDNAKTRQTKSDLQNKYNDANRQVKRGARRDKRKWADDLATEAEKASETFRTRDLYKITKTITDRNQLNKCVKPIKNARNELVHTKEEQVKLWENYYKNMLSNNTDTVHSRLCNCTEEEHQTCIKNINTDPPDLEEIKSAIGSIKCHKAPGPDSLPPELLKADCTTTSKLLKPLIEHFWINRHLPEELKEGLIIKIPKKGNLSDFKNWRGLTLLNMTNKIIAHILNKRITATIEPELRNEQSGFRRGKSCIDHISSLRIIVEESVEWRSPLYLLFIDFERAFDTLHHPAIWDALRCKGIPEPLIQLIKCLYDNASCRVLHEGLISNKFPVEKGVRQGCVLSPLLFNIVLDVVMGQSMKGDRGISFGLRGSLDDLDYADDICLLSHNFNNMQSKINTLVENASKAGLKVNIPKTKSLRINTNNTDPLKIQEHPLLDVDNFCYLGSILTTSGGSKEDIAYRIAKANQAFGALNKIWKSSRITLRTKIRLFNSNVKSVLLYGCETWNISVDDSNTLQVFVNRCLRRLVRIFWPETITNVDLWQRTKQNRITTDIRIKKMNWLGHTFRKSHDDVTRKALDYHPQGSRRRGRPANTWRRQIEFELRNARLTWREAKRLAEDRIQWKEFVMALCST